MTRTRRKPRSLENLTVEVIANPVPAISMAEFIVQALWGSKEAMVRDYLTWEAEKMKGGESSV